ncbi:hypothetical protein J3U22_09595, partial [Gilliamella sp. B2865]
TPPYLTFDGGRTRAVDANGLLGITLSDGTQYTPFTNLSSTTPISLPVEGQSFADISMFVPTDTNSVDLSTLIGPPNNYWGDDDGDSDVTVTGSLSLSIVDKSGQTVSRSTVPEICKAPYKVTLSSTDGTLSTRYGFPNRSDLRANSVTYYVNPKAAPVVCFARPGLGFGTDYHAGPSSMWDPYNGFIPQSTDSSLYGRNFPTTGANGLYFDLDIGGGGSLSWSPISKGGITATMTNSPVTTGVRVTLTGPYATESQINSSSPIPISKPTLPQTFELVGRDNNGTPVVKYGFTLKQWFVHRGSKQDTPSNTLSWCNSIGYRAPKVKDLTNSSCPPNDDSLCHGLVGATPSSPENGYMRHIGSGFLAEWGIIGDYSGFDSFLDAFCWTSDPKGSGLFIVLMNSGWVYPAYYGYNHNHHGLCTYP